MTSPQEKSLEEIAEQLCSNTKKAQLIYAFNGVGKTRLSVEFRDFITLRSEELEIDEERSWSRILYYNSFTEDLFYWNNNPEYNTLKIHFNKYTHWIFTIQGKEHYAIDHFQYYVGNKLTPNFSEDYLEISFSFSSGDNESINNIKISKGEESIFIWSIFYSLMEEIINVLNDVNIEERETDEFNQLEYIFIDDPVSSLDENHLIELAVNLASQIQKSSSNLKFIITTHNPLFYNILHNELGNKNVRKYIMKKTESSTYSLEDSNDSPFSYHLYLKKELEHAIERDDLRKYHFNLLRNILEKTATFMGINPWSKLLPQTEDSLNNPYYARIMNLSSHSKHSGEEAAMLTEENKRVLKFLVKKLDELYNSRMKI